MSQFCFPMLRIADIVVFFRDINVDVSESDVRKPDPLRWRQIYGIILELLTNISPDQVYQNCLQCLMVRSADVFEYSELHNESLPIGALVLSLQRLMKTCGIKDFSIQDITDPTPKRLQRTCSAAINLSKFRTKRVTVFEEYKEENKKYKELYDELRQMINKHKSERAEQEPEIKKNQNEIENLKTTMDSLHKHSAVMQKSIQEVKTDFAASKATMDQLKVEIVNKEKQIELISQKIVQSPEKIMKELDRNQEKMMLLKAEIGEKRNNRTEWGRQADKFKLRESTADKLYKISQLCKQEKEHESVLIKEISQNSDQYQELQTSLDVLVSKRNQLEARFESRHEAITKFGIQFAAKKKASNEQLDQVKSEKMLYTNKHNIEAEQMEDILKQKVKALDALQIRDKEVDVRLDIITSLYSQLTEKYEESNNNFEEEWIHFQNVFDHKKLTI